MINVVNDRLRVEHPSNGWPINAESGWQKYHNKADKTFKEIVTELANSRFNKTVFEGTATAQAFEWSIAESTWPVRQHRLRQKWESRPIGLVQSAFFCRERLSASMARSLQTCAKCICGLSPAGRRHPIGATPTSNTVRTTECRSTAGNAYVWISSHP